MNEHLFALLVHGHSERLDSLKRTLEELSIDTSSVETCREARELILRRRPAVILAESALPDGSWSNLLNIAETAHVTLSLIVVGAFPNSQSYLSAMDHGAFDFVAPPFEHESLGFVVRSAELDACKRRAIATFAAAA